jgi:hypothetical protein
MFSPCSAKIRASDKNLPALNVFFSETFLPIFFSSSTRLVEDLLVQEAML